ERAARVAQRARARHLRGVRAARPGALHAHQRLPAQPHRRAPQRVAVPRRLALSVHLRRRPRALLLAAARLPGDSDRAVHVGGHPPRVQDAEGVRAVLHHRLRASRLRDRQQVPSAGARQAAHVCARERAVKPRMGYKVAIVSDWYLPRIGGLELHLRDLARELNARGHEAHVITATPGPDELDGVKVHRLDVPLMPGLDTIRSRKALVPLEALFRREQYDIIHAHTALSPLAIGATRVAKKLGLPSVMTEHSVLRGRGQALLSALHKIWGWADWPDVLTAVSHYVAKEMREVSGRRDVYVLPNGINPRDWKPHNPPAPGEKLPMRVTTVMRFTKRKNPCSVIRAIPKINALLPAHIRPLFTLVGDGPERARVEREVKRLGVEAQVELTGFQPRHEIRK